MTFVSCLQDYLSFNQFYRKMMNNNRNRLGRTFWEIFYSELNQIKKVCNPRKKHWKKTLSVVFNEAFWGERLLPKNTIYIYIYHHVVPLVRIFLTLSRHFSLTSIASERSSILHPVSIRSCCRLVLDGPTLDRKCEGVHRITSLISLSLILQQGPACLRLISMGFEMGGRWLYWCCFVVCCFQYLFNIARSILVQLPSSFFSIHLVSIHVVHPYSSMDTTEAWKKLCFILSDRSDSCPCLPYSRTDVIFCRGDAASDGGECVFNRWNL